MPASRLYLLIVAATALASSIMFTTYAVYYVTELGLNPLQLVLVGTAVEATIFLFEVPTGVIADSYSRRLSVIIGMFVLGAAFLLQGAIPLYAPTLLKLSLSFFAAVVATEFIRGIGETFLSGALEAWVTDEVGEHRIGAVFVRAHQIGQAAGLLGILISVGLASIRLNLPYMVGGAIYLVLGAILTLAMSETAFAPSPRQERSTLTLMAGTFRDGIRSVRSRPVLLLILAVTLFAGAASEGFDRLWEAHFLTHFQFPQLGALQPVVWFGIISIAGAVLGIAANQVVRTRLDTADNHLLTKALLTLTTARVGCLVAFGLAGNFTWALLSFLAIGVLGSVHHPVYQTWLNQNIDSKVRATVLSILGQANAFGQMAGGPVVGLAGSRSSIRASMVLAAALLSPVAAVYARVLRRVNGTAPLPNRSFGPVGSDRAGAQHGPR